MPHSPRNFSTSDALSRLRDGIPSMLKTMREVADVARDVSDVLNRVVRLADPPATKPAPVEVKLEPDPVTGVYKKKV